MLGTFRKLALGTVCSALASIAGCAHHGHHPHHAGVGEGATGVVVAGRGEAKAAPDIARATIGLEIRAATAIDATTQANERMAAVLNALKGAGIAESDLRTTDFSISFERDNTPEPPVVTESAQPKPNRSAPGAIAPAAPAAPAEKPVRGSYRASNTVEVTMRDVSKVGAVLSAASSAGANNVWGIQFELADREPLRARARAEAVKHAQANAAQLAELAGVKLGRVRAIEDVSDGAAPLMHMSAMRAQMADNAAPVQSGELTVTHEVRVSYAIAE